MVTIWVNRTILQLLVARAGRCQKLGWNGDEEEGGGGGVRNDGAWRV